MKARPALPDDIKQLMALVRKGKLFDVQKWIAEGKRTVPPKPYWFSPLRVAVDTGFHSMVELLLRAGIDAEEKDYMLDRAVCDANLDLIKLLVDHGADLHSVEFEDVCQTGNPEIIRYFLDRGLDAVTGDPFAHALCLPKRPFLGIYMRYRKKIPSFKRQLNLALRHHAQEGNLKWVSLLLWAGGKAHIRLPDVGEKPNREDDTSALEEAVRYRQHEIVEKIGIDPSKDNLDRLLEEACLNGDLKMIDKLVAIGADPRGKTDCQRPMENSIWHLRWEMEPNYGARSEFKAKEALIPVLRLADLGARWNLDPSDLRRFRAELCHFDVGLVERVVTQFRDHQVCAPEVLLKLIGSPKMKQILGFRYNGIVESLKRERP